jgi:predicted amidohydrolase YtcJ
LGGDQRISVEEAVRAYTSHAAWFQFAEHERGSIEPGKLADFVLLSEDLMTMEPERIAGASVRMTMTGGRIVYSS